MNVIDSLFWRVVDELRQKGYEMIQSPYPEDEIFFEAPRNSGYDLIRLYRKDVNFRQEIVRDIEEQTYRINQLREAMRKRSLHLLQLQFTTDVPVDDWEDLNGQPQKENKVTVTPVLLNADTLQNDINELQKWLNTSLAVDVEEAKRDTAEDAMKLKRNVLQAFDDQEKQRERERAVFQNGRPIFTYLLIAVQVVMFLLLELSGGSTNTATLTAFGAKNNVLILEGEWWRLITPMFLHIGLTHLLFNTFALWSVGAAVERIYGSGRFLLIYLISGIFGSIASFVFNTAIAAGASGAIFGCLGALLYLAISNRKLFFRTMGTNIIVIILINLGIGFTVSGIDNAGHLGGLVGGFLTALAVRLPKQTQPVKMLLATAVLLLIGGLGLYTGFHSDNQKEAAATSEAASLFDEKKYSEASERLEEYVHEKDASAEALHIYALSEAQQGRLDKAIQFLQKSLEKDPDEPNKLYYLSLLFVEKGETAKADDLLAKALKQDPQNDQFLKLKQYIENSQTR
ncbi:rhomboid family protein [Bacillus safensis]|uniref:rhomboid family protein n=1 Tax=Bacillus safensis TaxID=561879 RepID=UPI000F887B23|nr:rhomboid family intramembrane serine protease [Bacillus safensis]MBU5207123.1 rhomboid family intramembrane serine protease [Bacillus safensis]RUK49243.1 rhomboid family intramembrane serine protease [Bacillus safensis]